VSAHKSQSSPILLIKIATDWSFEMNNKQRPYLTAALLCEKILEERNGTLSAIRIIDRVGYQKITLLDDSAQNTRPIVHLWALISLKSGPVTGEHAVKIIAENPNRKRTELFDFSITLAGGDQGQNFALNLILGADVDGLYWFDVLFDDDVLTRIPITIAPEPALLPAEKKN
jgi:hypothetical protein